MVARRPQLLPVTGASLCSGGGDDLRRRRRSGKCPPRCAPSSSRGGWNGWARCGAAAGDAYIRVVRAKAARASRVTPGGDSSGRCARPASPPLPSPSCAGRSAWVRPLSHPRSLVPGTPLAPARRSVSIPPLRAQPGLVHPAPLATGGGLILAFGPILQMEKLTPGARTCLVLGP